MLVGGGQPHALSAHRAVQSLGPEQLNNCGCCGDWRVASGVPQLRPTAGENCVVARSAQVAHRWSHLVGERRGTCKVSAMMPRGQGGTGTLRREMFELTGVHPHEDNAVLQSACSFIH